MNNTILVVDADAETEEKLVSVLEAENYLVFTSSGEYFSGEMMERTSPSLIFLKPAALSAEGFQTCKAIHNMDAFKNVPIVVLASLKVPLDPRYSTFYGIVDFLKMPLNTRDIIEKTEKILGSRSRAVEAAEEASGLSAESPPGEDTARPQEWHEFDSGPGVSATDLQSPEEDFTVKETAVPGEEKSEIQAEDAFDVEEEEEISENGQLDEEEANREEQDNFREDLLKRKPNKQGLLIPVIIAISSIMIVAAGFLSYNFFVASPAVKSVAVAPPRTVQKQETAVLPAPKQQQQEQSQPDAEPEGAQEVPKKAPAIVPKEKSVSNTAYSVQIGAFRSKGAADSLANQFKLKGYRTFTRTGTTKDNLIVYRVLIGHYETRSEAVRSAGQIRTREKIDTIIFGGKT